VSAHTSSSRVPELDTLRGIADTASEHSQVSSPSHDAPQGLDLTKRNTGMDLLRAVAIFGVISTHLANAYGSLLAKRMFGLGAYGVDLFFVLSGWLLGRQLLHELQTTGWIDVRRFWLRRCLRTLPAYYAILMSMYCWQIVAQKPPIIDLGYLVFIQNYYFETMPYFSISWSLCVEEYFYLAIAPLLLLCRGPKIRMLFVIALAIPITAQLMGWYSTRFESHVRYHACVLGVIIAYIDLYGPAMWARFVRLRSCFLTAIILAMGVGICARYAELSAGILETLYWSLVAGCAVIFANTSPGYPLPFSKALKYVATRAYALYLLHPFCIRAVEKYEISSLDLVKIISIWASSFLAAECLYRFLERPCMKLRELFPLTRDVRHTQV
jgi:peptidoglycan/LPS O-acetylase OafA/YrhL